VASLVRAASGPSRPRSERPPGAEGFIVFTSGTTGSPKGVVHTRASLDAILRSIQRQLQASEHDVFSSRELHLILPALFAGARVVIPRRTSFDAAAMLSDLERFAVTHTFLVTADAQALADHCAASQRALPASLRMLLIGGAPVPAAFLERLSVHLPSHTTVWCIYGMTEMLPVARVSLSDRLAWHGDGDFVGQPVGGVRARVAPDGELVVSGPGLFARYLGGEPVVEHRTGDIASIDARGITLLGRTRDMIIRGAHNIYPALYEPAFERVPGVRRCAMIGIPDVTGTDERVVVVVEPTEGSDAEQVVQTVRDGLRRGTIDIDGFAHPDHVLALELPQSGRSSKVDRAALAREVRARL
jgi:acyl-CoA synthetase (AMP-forming)/AMP-acid ligase II